MAVWRIGRGVRRAAWAAAAQSSAPIPVGHQYPESLIGETFLETLWVDLGFGPDERLGGFVVGINEGIDMLPELFDGAERCAAQGLALQDREPDFHLVEPRGPRWSEVEVDIRMTLEPAVVPWACGC